MKTIFARPCVMFVVLLVVITSHCFAQYQYVVTDLGTLGGSTSNARSINDLGQVVGDACIVGEISHSFLYSNGIIRDISPSFGFASVNNAAYDINNFGKVIGRGLNQTYPSFIHDYNTGQEINLSEILGNTENSNTVGGINNNGQVVGGDRKQGFCYDNGIVTRFSGPPSFNESTTAYDINSSGKIVAVATRYYLGLGSHELFTYNAGEIHNCVFSGSPFSNAPAINKKDQIVFSAGFPTVRAYVYSEGVKYDLGKLVADPGNGNYQKIFVNDINDYGRMVGAAPVASKRNTLINHAFVEDYANVGYMQDLNSLIPLNSGWTLSSANSINNLGQIVGQGINLSGQNHAFLLTPVGKCESFQVKLPTCTPIERLAKWDGSSWVAITAGELSNSNVHVLVHGWGPGLKTFSDNGGKIWDAVDPKTGEPTNSSAYQRYTDLAKSIRSVAQDDEVVMFNWLDMSATEDASTPLESRINTDNAAIYLKSALNKAGISPEDFGGRIQLVGMSHGARVATMAAVSLYNNDEDGNSLVVDHLTLGDSPDAGILLQLSGAGNKLQGELKKLNIGRTPGTTFVDNYYSCFGNKYVIDGSVSDENIVNVKLDPSFSWGFDGMHGYPIQWYTGATEVNVGLGLKWSPLLGDAYQNLSSSYEQDWSKGEYTLRDTSENIVDNIKTFLRSIDFSTLLEQGSVTGISGGIFLEEHSPAYWHAGFEKTDDDIAIEFAYQFLNPGDGDQLGIWIDDELRFIITGNLVGTDQLTTSIDISDLETGYHILSVALHSYGESGAIVQVHDFAMVVVPEPLCLSFLIIMTGFIIRLRKR